MFRLGIVSLLGVVALDVVVTCALYRVFRPVSDGLSLLATGFRLVYAGVFAVAITQLLGVLRLLGDDDHLAVFATAQVQAQALLGVAAFRDIWDAGLVLFGLHLILIGCLAYRSGFVPRALGILVVIAGSGYGFDGVGALIAPGSVRELAMFTFAGEVLLAVWLLALSRGLTPKQPRAPESAASSSASAA